MSNSEQILDFKAQLELQDTTFPMLQILNEEGKLLTKMVLNVQDFLMKNSLNSLKVCFLHVKLTFVQ